MPPSDLPSYESWDLTFPALPPRSRLFSLVPFGVGTAMVETLPSYLVRLAEAHCVPTPILIRYELAFRYVFNQQRSKLPHQAAIEASISFLRSHPSTLQNTTAEDWLSVNDQVEQIVRLLEHLTLRSDLRYLTLLPLSRFFNLRDMLRHEQCWCPACYQQQRDAGLTLYTPLLWALEPVCVCPKHHCYTQLWCTYCRRPQPFLSRETELGYCAACGAWLGHDFTALSHQRFTDKDWEWQLWMAEALGQILAAMPILHHSLSQRKVTRRHRQKLDLIEFLKRCHDLEVAPVKILFNEQNIPLPDSL
ncbi:TniQ family protein [Phormidesmis sp. 146-12]